MKIMIPRSSVPPNGFASLFVDGLFRVARERGENRLHVLLRIAEEQLARAQRLRRRRGRRRGRKLGESQLLLLHPVAVRLPGRDLALRLLVRDDPSSSKIDEEEFSSQDDVGLT